MGPVVASIDDVRSNNAVPFFADTQSTRQVHAVLLELLGLLEPLERSYSLQYRWEGAADRREPS